MRVRIVRTELVSREVPVDIQDFGGLVNETCASLEKEGFKIVNIDFERFRSHATAFITYRKFRFGIL